MKCVVTGGAGFIGSHVVDALRQAQNEVLVIDKVGAGSIQIDILDTKKLIETLKFFDAEVIFHLAAISNARDALNDPGGAMTINVGGTGSVLEAAKQSGVKRVVLASTCWVCNAMKPGLVDETEPFLAAGGGHPYTTSKIASEHLCHDFQQLYGLPFTILRYGIPYGTRMWSGLALRSFLDRAFAKQPLTIFGDGSAIRTFIYVEDLARAHVLALKDAAKNQTYNLEGIRPVTIKELAELVSRLVNNAPIEYKPDPNRAGEFVFRGISNAKALKELGWAPKVDLEEGVKKAVEWYRANLDKLQPNFPK